ncbi:uncharacterized protein LOC135494436 isoform X4 [Lineus longissimus]|uniref:uncharacterized protein LOC135494436 isoform X4 n=1 Tax=Lineus longissimus TaxID=88925 RepID=UPI00315D8D70
MEVYVLIRAYCALFLCVELILGTEMDNSLSGGPCIQFSKKEEFSFTPKDGRVAEFHIRQNIMGEITFADIPNDTDISLDINWGTAYEYQLDGIKSNFTQYHGIDGDIFIMQLDFDEASDNNSYLILGIVGAVVILVLICALITWLVRRRRLYQVNKARNRTEPTEDVSVLSIGNDVGNDIGASFGTITSDHEQLNNQVTTTPSPVEPAAAARGGRKKRSKKKEKRKPSPESAESEARRKEREVSPDAGTLPDTESSDDGGFLSNTPVRPKRHVANRSAAAEQRPSSPPSSDREGGRPRPPPGRRSPPGTRAVNKAALATMAVMTMLTVVYAACIYEYKADITVRVPRNILVNDVKVFLNSHRQGKLNTRNWSRAVNQSRVKVFELDDASLTKSDLCKPDGRCPRAAAQGLAGCDMKTGDCVCEKGYSLSEGICIDKNECHFPEYKCHAQAVCKNTIGSYLCLCQPGYFGDGKTCKKCSQGCSTGHFSSSPCNSTNDRVCSPCGECDGPTFEAAKCGEETQDTLCILVKMYDMYKRLQKITDSTVINDTERGFHVKKSSNVFLENLHAVGNRDNTVYVTDGAQAQDFFWKRESNLRVHIGVHNIHMVPEYQDVVHQSDNEYMLRNPNQSDDQGKFQNIVQNYCRHPMPDYYSITLEIMRDRTTAVRTITCDSRDKGLVRCDWPYIDGDKYTYRTLNQPCPKLVLTRRYFKGTFPEELQQVSNSISCAQETELLGKLFNLTMLPQEDIRFLSKDCQSASSKCTTCLKETSTGDCKANIGYHGPEKLSVRVLERDENCCSVNCYYNPYCRKVESPPCKTTPVECARGDAMRYTIQPVFENIKEEFHCHLKYQAPETLYKFFYYVEIPEFSFQTPLKEVVVNNEGLDYHSNNTFRIDFLQVEHYTQFKLEDEYVLVGNQRDGMRRFSFTLHPFKNESDFERKPIPVFKFSDNVFVLSAQTQKPFHVSTSNWQNGEGCYRSADGFVNIQKMYSYDGVKVDGVSMKGEDNAFNYFLKSPASNPLIRFAVPGNESILYGYFKGKDIRLIYDDTLQTFLTKERKSNRWNITLKGSMTACPAYLGIIILETITHKQYFHQDAFISCPPQFELNFLFPAQDYTIDRSFEILATDSEQTQKIFLSAIHLNNNFTQPVDTTMEMFDNVHSPWPAVVLIFIIFAFLSLFLFLVYIYLVCTEPKQDPDGIYAGAASGSGVITEADKKNRPNFRRSKKRTRILCAALYGVIRVLYNLTFTFTVFLAIMLAVNRHNLTILADFPEFQRKIDDDGKTLLSKLEEHRDTELRRQQTFANDMQKACTSYMLDMSTKLERDMSQVMQQHRNNMYNSTVSILAHVGKITKLKMKSYERDLEHYVDNYNKTVKHNFNEAYTKYGQFVSKVAKNGWLSFARKIQNGTKSFWDTVENLLEVDTKLKEEEVNFMSFLGVYRIENIQLLQTRFWQRFRSTMPSLTVFPESGLKPVLKYDCNSSVSNQTDINSFHFFETNSNFEEYMRRPRYHLPHLAAYSINNVNENILIYNFNMSLLFYVFLVLDAFLFIYRCFRTYVNILLIRCGFQEKVRVDWDHTEIKSQRLGTAERTELENFKNQLKHTKDVINEEPDDTHAMCDTTALRTRPSDETTQSNIVMRQRTNSPKSFIIYLKNICYSYLLPKILLAFTIGLTVLLVVLTTHKLLTVELIDSYNGFQRYAIAMDINTNLTNKYVKQQADYMNSIAMETYKLQMEQELRGLLSIRENFNLEQQQLLAEYKAEICALHQAILKNTTCDISMSPGMVNLDIIPCNFLPVAPKAYAGYSRQTYLQQLRADSERYVTAARELVFSTAYVVLIITSMIIIIHVIGNLFIYYLKSRHYLPKKKAYLMPRPPVGLDSFGRKIPDYRPQPSNGKPEVQGAAGGSEMCESQV